MPDPGVLPRGLHSDLTWSTWHGADQGSPPLPLVDPGAENHGDHVEHVEAQVACGQAHAVTKRRPGRRAHRPRAPSSVAGTCRQWLSVCPAQPSWQRAISWSTPASPLWPIFSPYQPHPCLPPAQPIHQSTVGVTPGTDSGLQDTVQVRRASVLSVPWEAEPLQHVSPNLWLPWACPRSLKSESEGGRGGSGAPPPYCGPCLWQDPGPSATLTQAG